LLVLKKSLSLKLFLPKVSLFYNLRMIKKIFVFLFILAFIFLSGVIFFSQGAYVETVINPKNNLFSKEEFNLLVLGKPGPGYIGSENTDTIFVLHYDLKKNTIYLISIPRDLVILNEKGQIEKINMLYGQKKFDLLFKVAGEYSGVKVDKYFAFDMELVKKLVNSLGGIEVEIDEPVVDAVSFYTLYPGKRILKGDDLDLFLRSRYHRQGDFFRIKNQIKALLAFKDKVLSLDSKQKLNLVRLFFTYRSHWQTNLNLEEIYNLLALEDKFKQAKFVHLEIDLKSGLLTSGYFDAPNLGYIYGIYPKLGLNNFSGIREYLRSVIDSSP